MRSVAYRQGQIMVLIYDQSAITRNPYHQQLEGNKHRDYIRGANKAVVSYALSRKPEYPEHLSFIG